MPRTERIDIGNHVYHVLNRANARARIFDCDKDYQLFENTLEEAAGKYDMRILSYCLMPNHWHLVLYPKKDGDMARFMGWIGGTHTIRWHAAKGNIGQGHLYQGRYKSFLCQNDNHFLSLSRYVESNAKRANLVKKAENWKWSSLWRRMNGTAKQKELLSIWPMVMPKGYLNRLNQLPAKDVEENIKKSVLKGVPYGGGDWVSKTVKNFGLEQTLRKVGRPKKNGV